VVEPVRPDVRREIRRKRAQRVQRIRAHWKWYFDEVYVKINGERHYLWRAIDHEGEVLESFATKARDKAAALKFIKEGDEAPRPHRHHRHRWPALIRRRPEGDRRSRSPGDRPLDEQPG
jgi:hypothetical protein